MNKLTVGAVVVGLIALGTIGVRQKSGVEVSIDSLPNPDLTSVESQVSLKLAVLRVAVEGSPQSAEAWGTLGMNYDVHGLKPEAAICYRQAAALDDREFRWSYFLAIVLDGLEDPEALGWYEHARDIRPRYAPMLVRMGNLQVDNGRTEGARATFQAAVDADNTVPQAFVGLVRIALAEHDVDEAAAQITAGLATNPNNRSLYGGLAEVYRRRGQMDLAARAQVTAQAPPAPRTARDIVYSILLGEGVSSRWYQTRGQEYLSLGMIDSAISNLAQAVRIRPEANAYNDLGIAFQTVGLFEDAVQYHEAALELRPNFVEAMVSLAAALQRTERGGEAIEYLQRARENNPAMPQIYLNLGRYYSQAGRDGEAAEALRSALETGLTDVRISMRLAWLLATSSTGSVRNGGESLEIVRALNDASPGNPYVLDVMAAALAETGDYGMAEEIAARALTLATEARIADLTTQIPLRLELYRSGRPYRAEVI